MTPQIIVKDNDGHTYIIPEADEFGFYQWVDAMEKGQYINKDYNDYRIDSLASLRILSWYEK